MSRGNGSASGATSIYKVVLLGEGSVGKTSMSRRYVQNAFDAVLPRTSNASYLEKEVRPAHGKKVRLAIWDTAGQERFHALAPLYYRDAHAALLVYDIADRASFARIGHWIAELQTQAPGTVLAIAGNKCDLGDAARQVSESEGRALADSIGAAFFETSAKLGTGLDAIFEHVAVEAGKLRRGSQRAGAAALIGEPAQGGRGCCN
jgi:small GTP-binding protein